ncbi:Trypsin domain containing protein, partial [Asbolus verrucosus]
MVAVGKYYRSYDDSRDVNKAEFSSVPNLQEIFIPRQYKGPNQNYFADIAILVTTKTFTISQRVQPVCVDWGLNYASELSNLSSSSYGHVTGWGFTSEDANPSEELRELRLPLVTREQCSLNLPEDYEVYFTYDKFCAGYLNKSVGICKGDAGSGLMLKHNDRYYITGIVSIGVRSSTGGCDSQQYGLYTSVYKYLEEFILDKISRFKPDNTKIDQLNENCILPKHPENGQWSVINSTLLQEPGESVTSGTAINLTCDESYTLDGPTFIQCKTGKWDDTIGICLTMCPTLISTSFITFTCINNNNNNCINPTHGTIATLKCAPFYENLDLDRNPFITCQNGRWSSQIPTCVPGAQCVCNTYGEKFPAINFKVAAGKSLENFEDSRDSEAQYSDLEDIFVPREYRGYTRRYRADIAILITKTPFTITEKVQLACLDWNNKYFNEFNYLEVKGYCYHQLSTKTDPNFDTSYYTYDKLCSGYINSDKATTLIVHGNNVTRSDYPWQVAIYRTNATKKELICGGTLINQRIILTAAHCVTDDEGNKLSKELFIVAAGKYYRDFDHPADKGAQFSTLIDVSVASQYQGYLQNYLGDIAVLITENSFILSKTVEPICIDWNDKYETQFFKPETSG